MDGQFSYEALDLKSDGSEIVFDVLKLTDDEGGQLDKPVITKNCSTHLEICFSLCNAQEQYIQKKEIQCPCGTKVQELNDLRKDIRWIVNDQFHQMVDEVQVIQGIFTHKYYRNQEFIDSLKQASQEMPNFLIEIKNNYNIYKDQVIEKINLDQKYLALCILDAVKIIIPVRIMQCEHVQCYELTSLLYYRQQQKRKKFFKCSYCQVVLNISSLQEMSKQLILDCYLLDIFNKGKQTQIQFMFEEDGKGNEQERLDPSIECFFEFLQENEVKQTISIEIFQRLVLHEISILLQTSKNEQALSRSKEELMKNNTFQLQDQITYERLEIPVRCNQCGLYSKSLDIKSYVSFYIIAKINQESQFECKVCGFVWSIDDKLSDILYVDYYLLYNIYYFDDSSINENNFIIDGKENLLNQIQIQQKLDRKKFIKTLRKSTGSTVQQIIYQKDLNIPLILKNCPEQNIIDFEYLYNDRVENKYISQNGNYLLCSCVECNNLSLIDYMNQIQFHSAYLDVLQTQRKINIRVNLSMYDFRTKQLVFQEKDTVQVVMIKCGVINIFRHYVQKKSEYFYVLAENIEKNVIIEIYHDRKKVQVEKIKINDKISFYCCTSLAIYFSNDLMILKLFSSSETLTLLENSSSLIQSYKDQVELILKHVNQNSQIQCLLMQSQQTELLFMLKLVSISMQNTIYFIQTDLKYEEIMDQMGYNSNKYFLRDYNIKVHQLQEKTFYFGQKQTMLEIKQQIQSLTQLKSQDQKQKILLLKNEILQQEIINYIQKMKTMTTKNIYQDPKLSIEYKKRDQDIQMTNIGQKDLVESVYIDIIILIKKIERTNYTIICQLPGKQLIKLQEKYKNEIVDIEKKNSCIISALKIPRQAQINLQLLQGDKNLHFITGAIPKLPYKIIYFKEFSYRANKDFQLEQINSIKDGFEEANSNNVSGITFDLKKSRGSSFFGYRRDQMVEKKEYINAILDCFFNKLFKVNEVYVVEYSESSIQISKEILLKYLEQNRSKQVFLKNSKIQAEQVIELEIVKIVQKTKEANQNEQELIIQSYSKEQSNKAKIELEKLLGIVEITIKNQIVQS